MWCSAYRCCVRLTRHAGGQGAVGVARVDVQEAALVRGHLRNQTVCPRQLSAVEPYSTEPGQEPCSTEPGQNHTAQSRVIGYVLNHSGHPRQKEQALQYGSERCGKQSVKWDGPPRFILPFSTATE